MYANIILILARLLSLFLNLNSKPAAFANAKAAGFGIVA
jgi:hypothetical protein